MVRDNKLRVPTNAANSTYYYYETDYLNFNNGTITKICPKLSVESMPSGSIVSMEIATDGNS